MAEEIILIPVEKLKKSIYNPRMVKDPEKFKILVESIKKDGIKYPLLVWRKGENYEVLDGSRRLEAAIIAGIKELPCKPLKGDEKQIATKTLKIHVSQEDLTPEEVVNAVENLVSWGFYDSIRDALKASNIPERTFYRWRKQVKASAESESEKIPKSTLTMIEEAEIPESKKRELERKLEEKPLSGPVVREMINRLEENPDEDIDEIVEEFIQAEPRGSEDFMEARGKYTYQLRYSGADVEFTIRENGLVKYSLKFPRRDLWIVKRLFQKFS